MPETPLPRPQHHQRSSPGHWPLTLLALLLWPIVWLIGIPFRLLGISVRGALELIESIVRLPGRVLGGRTAHR